MIFEQTPPAYQEGRPRQHFSFFTRCWDIDKAEALVAGREANACIDPTEAAKAYLGPQQIPGEEYENLCIGLVNVNVHHALSDRVDIARPLIAVRMQIGKKDHPFLMIIDGWHRVWRGRHDGVPTLPVHILTEAEEKDCRV